MENSGGLSERKYGFRAFRSMIGVINEVLTSVKAIESGSRISRKIVVLTTLDVRKAFNSLPWVHILNALRTKFAVPGYLMKIMQSYLRDHELNYDTNPGRRKKYVTSGAAQGSIICRP